MALLIYAVLSLTIYLIHAHTHACMHAHIWILQNVKFLETMGVQMQFVKNVDAHLI